VIEDIDFHQSNPGHGNRGLNVRPATTADDDV